MLNSRCRSHRATFAVALILGSVLGFDSGCAPGQLPDLPAAVPATAVPSAALPAAAGGLLAGGAGGAASPVPLAPTPLPPETGPLPAAPTGSQPIDFTGMCDASAGAALANDLFVVACDEDNTLRFYGTAGGRPVATQRLDQFLGTGRESDLEAVARAGDRLYWITSHGRNKNGEARSERHQFFATDVRGRELVPVGTPCQDLVRAMIADPQLASLKLDAAAKLAPEADGGLNIEGLAARPDGSLWIGFRNPRAVIVPLTNPAQVIAGATPLFGAPIPLDLGGRGVRSLEELPEGRVLIVAGPAGAAGDFALFTWSGTAADAPQRLATPLGTLRPEGVVTFPDGRVMLLSDDGGVKVGGGACKDLPDESARSFRGAFVALAGDV